jgi:hypothetical protein
MQRNRRGVMAWWQWLLFGYTLGTVFCIVSQRVMRHVMLKDYDDAIAEGTRRTTWERDR